MVDLDQEYDLFRKICRQVSLEVDKKTDANIQRFIKKGLKLKLRDNFYVLTNELIVLSSDKIRSGLNKENNTLINRLDVIYETDSTNKAIVSTISDKNYSVLLAESQTKGSGRRKKTWISPLGENIYLSIKFQLKNSKNLHFLPLITAVSICKSLKNIGVHGCQIKWPNDIYIDDKKLGGILVESRYNIDSGHIIIVGIGLNINMESNLEIDQSWTSLFNKTNNFFDRNIIVSTILSDLIENFEDISELNTQQFMMDWKPLDYLKKRKINIIEDNYSYSACALGISEDGALLVEYVQNKIKMIKKVYSADVSVKAFDEL